MEDTYMGMPAEVGEMAIDAVIEKPHSDKLKKIVKWIVYAAAFLVPLWFLPFTADISEFNKQVLLVVLAGAGLILFLVDVIKGGVLRIRSHRLFWSFGGLLVATIVTTLLSVQRSASIFGVANGRTFSLVSIIAYLVILFLAVNVIEDRGRRLREVITSSAGLALLFSVLQIAGIHLLSGTPYNQASFNTVGSVNGLAFFGVALIPLFLIAPGRKVAWQTIVLNILRYVGFVSTIFLLMVLNWSPLWILAFIMVLGLIAFTSSTELKKGKMKFFALPMGLIVLGAFLMIIGFNWSGPKSKLPVEVAPTQASSYAIATASLKQKPLGYGPENFIIAYDALRAKSSVNNALFQIRFTDGATEISNMMVEGGMLMMLAYASLIVFVIMLLIRNVRRQFGGDSTNGKVWASVLSFMVIPFLYPLSITVAFMLFLMLAAGLLATEDLRERVLNLESKGSYSFVGSLGFIIGLVVVLLAGFYMTNQYVANIQFANALAEKDRGKSIDYFVKSINSYNKDSRAYQLLSQALVAQVADDLKVAAKTKTTQAFNDAVRNRIANAINIASSATEINPADSDNWLNRGYIYQNFIGLVPDADKAAITMYQETVKRNPANALAYVRMGNVYLTLADNAPKGTTRETVTGYLDKAEEDYKQAIALYSNYGQALYNLAATYDRKGELSSAIKEFEKLQATAPRDPSVLFQLGLLYYRNGQKENAIKAWETAISPAYFPNYSNARWYLSLAYEEKGDLTGALAQVKEIEKLNPGNQLVMDRIDKLEAGIRIIPPATVLEQQPLNNVK